MDSEDNSSTDVTQIDSEPTTFQASEDESIIYTYPEISRNESNTSSAVEDTTKSIVLIKSYSSEMSKKNIEAVACILEDTIDKLTILGYTNNKQQVEAQYQYKTLQEKYGNEDRSKRRYEIMDGPCNITERNEKLAKIQRDRSILQNVLQKTLEELLTNGTYNSLIEFVSLETLSRSEDKQLILEEQENTTKMNEMRSKIQEGKFHQTAELVQLDERIAKLKDTIQDIILENEAQKSYVQKWEAAREEQNSMSIELEEKSLMEKFNKIKFDTDTEIRVHTEIQSFLEQAKTKLRDDIERWMNIYENEYEEWELKINNLKYQWELQQKSLEEVTMLYEHRAIEIREYEEAKRKKEEYLAHQKYLNEKATKIQAWWRGTMVRRGLGPFRKKKKDKGKGKKGKGKK